MRRLGYGLLALLLILALVPLASIAWQRWEGWRNLAPARTVGLDERVLFEPRGGQALQFNVSTHHGWFALQGFMVAAPESRAQVLPVTLEIGLHGTRGVERERRYLALPAVDRAHPYGLLEGDPRRAAWVLPTEWIDLADRPDVRTVSVRVIDLPAAVDTVLWRGAIDQRLSDADLRLRYRRLSGAARENLTARWITPAALVEPTVKRELLRYRQQRVAPLGQPGEAFVARRVLRQPATATPRRYDPRPVALAIGPSLHVSVEIDEPLQVIVDARRPQGAPLPITIEGPFAAGGAVPQVRSSGRWEGRWRPGRYVLRSDAAGDVEVRDSASGDSLVPSGNRPRTRRAAPGDVPVYRLVALDGAPPPVRLELRPERGDARARLRFVDAGGTVLAAHDVDLPRRASRYDRLAAQLDRAAAEPVQVNLQPPAEARALHVDASAPVLVHALTTVPGATGERRWFSFQPESHPRSAASQGIVVVEQPRPARARAAPATPRADVARPAARRAAAPATRRAADRPRLRLRPARAEETEDDDAD